MARIAFVGDPNDNRSGPEVLQLWGVAFRKGEMTEVSPEILLKAAKHSHFEIETAAPITVNPVPKKGRK